MDVGLYAFPSAAKAMWFMGCACSTNTFVLPMIAAVIPRIQSLTEKHESVTRLLQRIIGRGVTMHYFAYTLSPVVLHLSTFASHKLRCWLSWESFCDMESPIKNGYILNEVPCCLASFAWCFCISWRMLLWMSCDQVARSRKCDPLHVHYPTMHQSLRTCVAYSLREKDNSGGDFLLFKKSNIARLQTECSSMAALPPTLCVAHIMVLCNTRCPLWLNY